MESQMVRLAGSDTGDTDAVLAIGRRALASEAEALWALAHTLDRSFADAVDILRAASGRIVVCGLGKSGHIARKIAATLTATGSPAIFLHAAEALHGDLGLLVRGDALLVLSKSGETREIAAVVRHAETLAIPIVAITAAAGSPVAGASDACVILPTQPEVCAHGSAPTTSTTMMMALGDALAVALMRCRDVDAATLRRLHPDGRLGVDLTPIDRIMHRGDALPLASPDAPMADVLALIGAKRLGIAGIVDAEERLLGVITDGDIRRHANRLPHATAREVMTASPQTLGPDAIARDALALLSQARITAVFVVDPASARAIGVVHVHDLLRLGIG